jgi:hypothetical protein
VLYDVDIVFKEQAESLGMQLERIEMLNTAPQMIDGLAETWFLTLQRKRNGYETSYCHRRRHCRTFCSLLRAQKSPDLQVTLLEAGDRWGGKIATDRVPFEDGEFIIEGGPDTFLATKPWGVALCKELGLATACMAPTRTKKTPTFCTKTNSSRCPMAWQ